MSYPEVEIVGISDTPPALVSEFSEPTEELVDEVLEFYRLTLIPQLACSPDGSYPAIPSKTWVMAEDKTRHVAIVRSPNGAMQGAWFVREGQIMFPVANNEHIALIYRMLWDETVKHFDYVWAMTDNPVIQAFIKMAKRATPLPTSPSLNEKGDRLEWRR